MKIGNLEYTAFFYFTGTIHEFGVKGQAKWSGGIELKFGYFFTFFDLGNSYFNWKQRELFANANLTISLNVLTVIDSHFHWQFLYHFFWIVLCKCILSKENVPKFKVFLIIFSGWKCSSPETTIRPSLSSLTWGMSTD